MKRIYKYASVDTGIAILEKNTVVVTNPLEFNDINDSELFVKQKDIKKGIETYISFLNEVEIYNEVKRIHMSENFRTGRIQKYSIRKFLSKIDSQRKQGIKKGYYSPKLTVGRLRFWVKLAGFTLNDEQKSMASNCFEQIDIFTNNVGLISMKDLIELLPTNIRVSCFSLKPNISKMWSHYANNHNGVCIEYDKSIESVPVNYVKKNHYVKFNRLVHKWLSFLLQGKHLNVNQDELIRFIPLLNKSKDWKEEMEERMIVSSKDTKIQRIIVKGKKLELYPVPTPTRVIIGTRVNELDRKRIMTICNKMNIPVEFCHKSKNYKLTISKELVNTKCFNNYNK